jgi:hypothetical protein
MPFVIMIILSLKKMFNYNLSMNSGVVSQVKLCLITVKIQRKFLGYKKLRDLNKQAKFP